MQRLLFILVIIIAAVAHFMNHRRHVGHTRHIDLALFATLNLVHKNASLLRTETQILIEEQARNDNLTDVEFASHAILSRFFVILKNVDILLTGNGKTIMRLFKRTHHTFRVFRLVEWHKTMLFIAIRIFDTILGVQTRIMPIGHHGNQHVALQTYRHLFDVFRLLVVDSLLHAHVGLQSLSIVLLHRQRTILGVRMLLLVAALLPNHYLGRFSRDIDQIFTRSHCT
mmetsp:Transcript_52601/g.87109  ORF Transcript_52601/g.87109 Transcript_52601/m.87109 type:complete len:227 (-) Transcript_52601:271-951(-)